MLLPIPVEQPPQIEFGAAFGAHAPLPGTSDCEWSLKLVHAREAWKYSKDHGKTPQGEEIVIGHPETRYTPHVENWTADPQKNRLRYRDGYDVRLMTMTLPTRLICRFPLFLLAVSLGALDTALELRV